MNWHSCPGRIQQAPYRTHVAVSRCLLRLQTGRRNQYVGSTVDPMMHIPVTSRTQTSRTTQAGRQRLPVPLVAENRSTPTAATMVNDHCYTKIAKYRHVTTRIY